MKICHEKEFLLCHDANDGIGPSNERLKRFLDEWQTVEYSQLHSFNGGNDSTEVISSKINHQSYLVPPKCEFFNTNIKQFGDHEHFEAKIFDLITLDPPWWNKYVRRSRNIQRTNG